MDRAWAALSCKAQNKLESTPSPVIAAACHPDVFAVTDGTSESIFLFYKLQDVCQAKTLCLPVCSAVTALCISSHVTPYLFACSSVGIQRWFLSFAESVSLLVDGGGISPPDLIFEETNRNTIVHLSANKTGNCLIACIDTYAIVINTSSGRVTARLEGHTAAVTGAAFRTDLENCAITISEDRRFIVYDLSSSAVLFQSSIVSSSPFVCLAVEEDPAGACCAIGSSDGKARVYDLASPGCRLLYTFDIPSITGANLTRPPAACALHNQGFRCFRNVTRPSQISYPCLHI